MEYKIIEKKVEPKFLFIGAVNLERIEKYEDGYRNYKVWNFSIEISKGDIEEFIKQKVFIDYFGSSRKYIACIEHLDMFVIYIAPKIKEALISNIEHKFVDLSQHMKIEYLSEYGINQEVAISFTDEEKSKQKEKKEDLKAKYEKKMGW